MNLLKNWWQLRTSTDIASREMAIQMESWLEGYEEYAMERVGWICELVTKEWREVLGLEWLYLQYKKLPTLPAEIGNLQGLGMLYLRNNNLTNLPAEIGNLQALKYLHLNDNNLTTLPAEIGKVQGLKWLRLDNNPITKTEQERIRKLLPNCNIYF